tara:strand:+ start:29953 stop:32034 length:2082 start_codon:yes stop_codon:yes gene_type:complete
MKHILLLLLFLTFSIQAQISISLPANDKENNTQIKVKSNLITLIWPSSKGEECQLIINLEDSAPIFNSMGIFKNHRYNEIVSEAHPEFILNVGKRNLEADKKWNIFFDKVPTRPYESHLLNLKKKEVKITKTGKRTLVSIGEVSAPDFTGDLEITIYNDTPLINIAAVVSTPKDSIAILYDSGLITNKPFQKIAFVTSDGSFNEFDKANKASRNEKVKYRTILGANEFGSLAIFPAPHQYFYPLDEAFNLAFVWHGLNYRNMFSGSGIGIRQDPEGDKRFVPWFNAPPQTKQRLNFFCLLSIEPSQKLIDDVKKYTHDDTYTPLNGYQTLASHFHNEFIMNEVMNDKSIIEHPEFVDVFKEMRVAIVHLGEFHYTAHPKGPDEIRLNELQALFQQCERLSDTDFLLLPGEEPNEFLGGHWMAFFPRPVYWIMSREENIPFMTKDPKYGKVYHIGNEVEMQQLLELEQGLAWTAHPRIKGSTGFPDAYNKKDFFKLDRFLGGAWKAMPADLSKPKLGLRVLDLLDDMNNWGFQKKIIAESDLFTITKENEMYAHMNINYVQIDEIPTFKDGWKPVLDAMSNGEFFSTTGEILIPLCTLNGQKTGKTLNLESAENVTLKLNLKWTFPLNFIEIVSGDGEQVYRQRIKMDTTTAFGNETFTYMLSLQKMKWARVEVWDVAANGAFTQSFYLSDVPK